MDYQSEGSGNSGCLDSYLGSCLPFGLKNSGAGLESALHLSYTERESRATHKQLETIQIRGRMGNRTHLVFQVSHGSFADRFSNTLTEIVI